MSALDPLPLITAPPKERVAHLDIFLRLTAFAMVALLTAGCSPRPSLARPATPSPSVSQPTLVTAECADLIVLGARGSDQSATKNFGSGAEVRSSVTAMAERLHTRSKTRVRLVGVPYPAASGPAYMANVQAGVQQMRRLLERLSRKCPHSRFGLVGFSQGAQIVHGFALELAPTEARRVVVVGMISDPRRNPDDAIESWSYADSPTTRPGKLGAGTLLPARVRSKAISFCFATDEICNWPEEGYSGRLSQTHRHFYETPAHARQTGKQLAVVVERNGL